VYIGELHTQLIEVARQRVRAGLLTERGLARSCGVSQPHMHNVLKQIRSLSTDSADRLMHALELSVPALLWRFPAESETQVRAVPVLRNSVGPGTEAAFTIFRGYVPFPARLVEGLVEPVAACLGPDLVLPNPLAAKDLVLLDQNPAVRAKPAGAGYWVVADGTGLRVRYVRLSGTKVFLPNEANLKDPSTWQSISLRERNIQEIVRARIVWISREMEGPAA
jgi:hypothetical protein